MNIRVQITRLRKEKGCPQNDLVEADGASREIIGRYERSDAIPSVEIAKKIADTLEITLDNWSPSISRPCGASPRSNSSRPNSAKNSSI